MPHLEREEQMIGKPLGTLDRRQLFFGSAAAALTLCAGTDASAQSAPKTGGRLRLGLSHANTNDENDPATWGTSLVVNVGLWGAVYNNLVEIAPDGQIIPELAETFEASEDAKTWTFKLRAGVVFHDGKTLDSDDVVASLNHHRGPSSKSGAKSIVSQIDDLKTDGKNIVIVTLKEGNADFPVLCTDYHLVIGAARDGKINWDACNGTGGYKFLSHQPGISMHLKRNPGYWKVGRAHFEEAELLALMDPTARMNAIVTGEVDAINRVDLKILRFLERNQNIVIQEVTGTQQFTLPMFTDVAPFSDDNVRLALKYAIDRQALVQTILSGHGKPGNDNPITPANRYFAADIPLRQYDPDKSKFFLKKAGQASLKVDLHAADAAFNGAVDTAVLFKEQAAQAGIDINIVREPNDGYWTNVWLKKPFVTCYWAGRASEDWMFSQVYARGSIWNDTHWNSERFNQLLIEARTELDTAKRRAMYHEMQQLVRDDGGVIIPMYPNWVDARSKKIAHGPAIGSNYDLDGWKCIERWWMV
jgi:peptide/nickel transport system substrate-binding protein